MRYVILTKKNKDEEDEEQEDDDDEALESYSQSINPMISGLQNRNRKGARLMFSTATSTCSDNLFNQSPINKEFCENLLAWSMQRRSFLKHTETRSFALTNSSKIAYPAQPNNWYRMGDPIQYEVKIEEYNADLKKWVPFIIDNGLLLIFLLFFSLELLKSIKFFSMVLFMSIKNLWFWRQNKNNKNQQNNKRERT